MRAAPADDDGIVGGRERCGNAHLPGACSRGGRAIGYEVRKLGEQDRSMEDNMKRRIGLAVLVVRG